MSRRARFRNGLNALLQILFEGVMDPVLEPVCLNLWYHIFEELVVLKFAAITSVELLGGFRPQRIEVTVERIC